jgi:hypothetical protein
MFDNDISLFRRVMIGVAAENKKLGSDELLITSHEKLGFIDGEIVDKVDPLDYDSTDIDGKAVAGTAFVSNNITAKWLPSTNRRTPPDVQRGEMVEVYQYASNDEYFWRSMGKSDKLRRLETVVIGIAANPNMDQDGLDLDNMYFLEVSSHQKTITLSTSQKNGEFCTYDFQFDMAKGKVVLQDNLGNYGFLDSRNTHIKLQNQLGTFFELNKQDIKGYAPRDINLTAVNNVDVKAKKITLNGGGSVFTLQASGTTLKTPNFKGMS